ncbi:MAG: transketolase [Pseudomonadota bacterium]
MTSDLYNRWAKETVPIRENILKMIHQAKSGHPGGSLSCVEIIYALFAHGGVMKHDPLNPTAKERDRFVLSKGHCVPTLYSILSTVGYDIPTEELMTLRHLGSRLQGHPDRVRLPFVEASTGSLGQGASMAQGLAMAYRLDNINGRIFALIGDGESQEGQIWEMALSAAHHKLSNLTVILDYNKGQIDGPTDKVCSLEPVKEKWQAFGWQVQEVDGHKYQDIVGALKNPSTSKPNFILANTIKGKGVSFMENNNEWHGKAPSDEELRKAIEEIKGQQSIGL